MKEYESEYKGSFPQREDEPSRTFEARVRTHAIGRMKTWFTTTDEGQERMRRMNFSSTDTSSGHVPTQLASAYERGSWDAWYYQVEAQNPNWDPAEHRDASGNPQTIRQWVASMGGPRAVCKATEDDDCPNGGCYALAPSSLTLEQQAAWLDEQRERGILINSPRDQPTRVPRRWTPDGLVYFLDWRTDVVYLVPPHTYMCYDACIIVATALSPQVG